MIFDFFIEQRLSESRLILLIMSISSKANNINEDVLLKLLSVGNCNFHAFVKNVRDISVDVNDGSIDCLGNLCTVVWRSTLFWIGGEANLVVEYNMNNTSRTVIDQILEAKWLPNNTLTGHSSVTMDNDSHNSKIDHIFTCSCRFWFPGWLGCCHKPEDWLPLNGKGLSSCLSWSICLQICAWCCNLNDIWRRLRSWEYLGHQLFQRIHAKVLELENRKHSVKH